jgi:hypothetical protein
MRAPIREGYYVVLSASGQNDIIADAIGTFTARNDIVIKTNAMHPEPYRFRHPSFL